ncbi:hypothetical protein D3C71_1334650 [compost metagenome]
MFDAVNTEISKAQIEIEIHSEMLKAEYIPDEMIATQRKIETFNKNLDYLEKRKAAILILDPDVQ